MKLISFAYLLSALVALLARNEYSVYNAHVVYSKITVGLSRNHNIHFPKLMPLLIGRP